MVPVIVGWPASIESPCPVTGKVIKVRATAERVDTVDPPSAVVTLVRPDKVDDIRGKVCELGSFVASEEAAADWLAAYPQGTVHSVADDFDLHREVALKLGWEGSKT